MLYKIESIKHSRGTLKGLDRQDDRYPMRIGRIISLDIDDILIDFPLIIKYVRDSDGTPMRWMILRTSLVKSFEYIKDNYTKEVIKKNKEDYSQNGIIHLNIFKFLMDDEF